jgi:adenylate cyclase
MVWLSKRKRRFFAGLLVAVSIGIALCFVSHFNLLHGMQLQVNDFIFKAANLQTKTEPDDNIVIVAIDDKSLDHLGRFSSWPRTYHADLISILAEAEARIIVFDVLFAEPAPGDDQLVASIRRADNVILPLVCTFTVHYSSVLGDTISFGNVVKPLGVLEESAVAVGHANMLPDEDGVVRRLPLVIPADEYYEPSLALATVAKYLRRSEVIESPVRNSSLPFAGRSISLDSTNSMLINYTDDSAVPLSFTTVSYVDVLKGDITATVFQDKIVVIGATAAGLGDSFWTPMGRMMNGVELHANAMRTILSGNFLNPAPSFITIASILILALLCGLVVLRFRMLWATLLAIFLGVAYFIAAFSFFDNGIWLNMLYPPLTVAGAFVGVNVYNTATERAERREITRTFGRYVSPSVVDKILATSAEDELKLGGQEQEVTVMFADVRGFASISEKMLPKKLVWALNIYISAIIKAVFEHDGTINKFGGDSVMATWNVPIGCKEHALLATRAAVSAQRAIVKLHNKESNLPEMQFGMGVNTGKALAGNMGSEDRLEYSVIGDTVNTAARLADAAPGGKVWIGADTFTQVKDYITAELLKPLSLKGKRKKVRVYEVIDIQGNRLSRLSLENNPINS